jgi:hypothetical protein
MAGRAGPAADLTATLRTTASPATPPFSDADLDVAHVENGLLRPDAGLARVLPAD